MEKIIRSVNALKLFYGEIAFDEKTSKDDISPKERQNYCNTITDTLISNIFKGHADFSSLLAVSLEILLQSCSDESADVRLNAEECLNRMIKGLHESSMTKILVELFKEIKKNGSSRSLKAALTRFSDLCFNIRPSKCRPYILSLLPCLVHVSQREEEIVQEALSTSITKIFSNLGSFANEGEVQGLIASFLKNLSRGSVMVRRTAAACLQSIVSSSRKLSSALLSVVDSVMDILFQRWEDRSTILGCIQSLRLLSPLVSRLPSDDVQNNIFITKFLSSSLRYVCHSDHTVITSALELLEQLLKTFPIQLKRILINEFQIGQREDSTHKKLENSDDVKKPPVLHWTDITTSSVDLSNPNQFPITKLARMLCQRFLLSHQAKQLLPDSQVRVSIKTLALNCVSLIITTEPILFLTPVYQNLETGSLFYDVTLYLDHSDPKIRGALLVLLASYLRSMLMLSNGNITYWYEKKKSTYSDFPLPTYPCVKDIVVMLLRGFTDDSSTCLRLSCNAVSVCVNALLRSEHFKHGLSLLDAALSLRNNSYWLLKNDLLDLLSSLNYRHLTFLECNNDQESYMQPAFCKMSLSVMLDCLSDDDSRVRKAAVDSLLAAFESFPSRDNLDQDYLSLEAHRLCSDQLNEELLGNVNEATRLSNDQDAKSDKSLLKTYRGFEPCPFSSQVGDNLSLVVGDITFLLSQSLSKSTTRGCLLALKFLSFKYPPSRYSSSWGFYFTESEATIPSNDVAPKDSPTSENTSDSKKDFTHQLGLLPIVLGLLRSSWLPLDITTYCDALILAGNLIAGAAVNDFCFFKKDSKTNSQSTLKNQSSNSFPRKEWSAVSDPALGGCARELFFHIVKLISMSHHVISDIPPVSTNKSVLPNISSSPAIPSPMKKKKDTGNDPSKQSPPTSRKLLPSTPLSKSSHNKEDLEKEKPSKKSIGSFHHNRVLMKLHELLIGAYKNYKGSLEFSESDRFCFFISSILDVFCQLLEIANFSDISSCTDELLGYFKSTFKIHPSLTVQSVQQLLKALFGTNLFSQIEDNPAQFLSFFETNESFNTRGFKSTLSHQIFHLPLNNLSMSLANSVHESFSNESIKESTGWFGSIKKKVEQKLSQSGKSGRGNKMTIQHYIRLFEPLVIKSLKLYTVTSSVELQKHVLNMLAQLVQLRVNYNMLDSDQIFINFVIKQFESIEGGMILKSDSLIPHVFFFLVLLTYEMYHSKGVIGMSKVIQLSEGLMASGCDSVSHVIPALEPIVHDLFVVRVSVKSTEVSTQREVVFAMLIKLVQFPQVFPMLTSLLRFYRNDDVEKWKVTSRLVASLILPLLKALKISLKSYDDMNKLHTLFETFPPSSLPPIESLLDVMLTHRLQSTMSSTHLWLGKCLLLLRFIICNVTEADLGAVLKRDDIASRLNTMKISNEDIRSSTEDNVDDEFNEMAKFLHQTVFSLSLELRSSLSNPILDYSQEEQLFFVKEFIELLLLLTHMHRSGTYKKLTAASRSLDHASPPVLANFILIGRFYPLLTLLWAQYLTQLVSIDLKTWSSLTGVDSTTLPVTFSYRLINAGTVILLCDYACQNTNQEELIMWLVNNHARDVIALSGEAPVEDFLSMIERLPTSKAFLRQITNYCEKTSNIKMSFMQRIIKCISSLSESYDALQLLLSPQFLFSPVISLSRSCDRLSCVIVESLLAHNASESAELITSNEVVQLLETFPSKKTKRFSRLQALLARLQSHLTDRSTSPSSTVSEITVDETIKKAADKDWLKSVLYSTCCEGNWSPECAKVLSCFEYDDVIEFMSRKEFCCFHLDVCVACGISECVDSNAQVPAFHDDNLSSILKASLVSMVTRANEMVNKYDKVHSNELARFQDFCSDVDAKDNLFTLCRCFARYFHADAQLPKSYKIKNTDYPLCLKLAQLACQIIYLLHNHNSNPPINVFLSCFEFLQQMWKIDEISVVLNNSDIDVVFDIMQALHCTVEEYVGPLPQRPPYFPSSLPSEELNRVRQSCQMTSQLLDLFCRDESLNSNVPDQLSKSIHNIILHLCRSKYINSYIRVPRVLWKYGWDPVIKDGIYYPDIPPEYLQEKEVLSEFIGITNCIGWVSRTQFEETWASLLGVLVSQPLLDESAENHTNDDPIIVSCLAVKGLTSLVISSSLQPHGGAPATGYYVTQHRHPPLKLTNMKWGKKLMKVRSILHEELRAVQNPLHHCEAHFRYQRQSPGEGSVHDLLAQNVENGLASSKYALGQMSAHSFYEHYGISPIVDDDVAVDVSMEGSSDGSDRSDVFDADRKSPSSPNPGHVIHANFRDQSRIDAQSCVQFLLDLYSSWLRTNDPSVTAPLTLARPLFCESVRSILLVSDLFTQRHQFEWVINTLSLYSGAQIGDDDVILQYLITSICKAAAVLGMNARLCDIVLPLLETAFASSLISCRTSAVYGVLYCLECYPNKNMTSLVRLLLELIPKEFVALSGRPSLHNEDFVLALISLSYFTIERCHDAVTPEFVSVILQASSLLLSAPDVSTRIYQSVTRGLEKLSLLFALSALQCESVLKVAADQLNTNLSLPRAMSACALMLTCMYCGRIRATLNYRVPEPHDGDAQQHEDEMEMNLVAMERISILFERIRKGRSLDARILIRILPHILQDYFPPATVLNKVIAEFASSFQPYPDFLALLLYKVFQQLHNTDQSALVNEWVILSLSNMIQKTPLSSAVWCLTCFFISASTNYWINSLLPVVASRMKQTDPPRDWSLFCKAAIDFYNCQLTEELDRRSFQSVFIASAHEEPYRILIHHLTELPGASDVANS